MDPEQRPSRSKPASLVGVHVGLLGAILVIVSFFMPWVSCQGTRLSGLQLASGSEGLQADLVLFLLPIGALAVLGLVMGRYMAQTPVARRRLGLWQAILGIAGALAGSFVLLSTINQKSHSAFGGLIHIEPGMWLGILGFVAAAIGGIAWRGGDSR